VLNQEYLVIMSSLEGTTIEDSNRIEFLIAQLQDFELRFEKFVSSNKNYSSILED